MESRRICVRGVIVEGGKIYAQKLKRDDASSSNFWCTPGGGLDPMESLHDGLHREMVEETGVAPQIGRLLLVQQFAPNEVSGHYPKELLEFFFLIENASDYQDVNLSATSHGENEVAEHDFIDPTTENLLPSILTTQQFLDSLNNASAEVLFHVEDLSQL